MQDSKPADGGGIGRRFFELVGFAVLVFIAILVVRELIKDDYSHGPEGLAERELIMAPGIEVELLPSARELGNTRFTRFDVSGDGVVLVGNGSDVFDMSSGESLFGRPLATRSFAFFGDTVAVVTKKGELGYSDGDEFRVVAQLPNGETALASSSDRSRMFLYRESHDDSGASPAIVAMRVGEAPEVLTGSFTSVRTVAGDAFQTYYSDRNALFQIAAPGRPSLVLALPDVQDIVGVAAAGKAVYFSTAKTVYSLDEDMAIPLVIGIGGELRMSGADVYVLDSDSGRVYRITSHTEGAHK